MPAPKKAAAPKKAKAAKEAQKKLTYEEKKELKLQA